MDETYVRLLCPECRNDWGAAPSDLPDHTVDYDCPDCETSRQLAEFTRTERDLQTLKSLG